MNKDIHQKQYNKTLLMIVIMVGSFVAVLNQTLLATALPHLMEFFNIEASTAQWLTTGFMLTNAIMIPITALLLEKISTKKLFIFAFSLFGIGTVLCAFTQSFGSLLIGRITQAAGAGIMMPLVNTVLFLIFPKEKRGFAMGLYGLIISFAPAIGPTISGLIVDNYDWHYLFYMLIPIIVVNLILAFFFMKDIIPNKDSKIDILSIVLSSIGLGTLLYGFSSAGSKGWDDKTVIMNILIGLVFIVLFIIRQLTMKTPMLELRVFKTKTFALTTAIGVALSIVQAGSTIIVPLFLQGIQGKSAFTSGLVELPGALLMAATMIIAGKLFDKFGAKKIVIPGIILLVVASIPFSHLNIDVKTSFISSLYAIRFVGLGLVIMPLQTAGMNALDIKLMPHATAAVNMTKQVAGSLGAATLITIMSNITANNTPQKSLAAINPLAFKEQMVQATITGMNTTFLCVTGVAVVALVLSFFLPKSKKTAKN